MIAVHRDYCLSRRPDLHAHIEVNPVGKLKVEIVELQECHSTAFDDLSLKAAATRREFAVKTTRLLGNSSLRFLTLESFLI